MDNSRLDKLFDFFREIDKEKFIGRQTYLTDGKRKENDSNFKWLKESFGLKPVDLTDTIKEPLCNELSVKEGYMQLIPGKHLTDGFFIAKLYKE